MFVSDKCFFTILELPGFESQWQNFPDSPEMCQLACSLCVFMLLTGEMLKSGDCWFILRTQPPTHIRCIDINKYENTIFCHTLPRSTTDR